MSATIIQFPYHKRQAQVMASRKAKQTPVEDADYLKTAMEGHMLCMAVNVYGKAHFPGMPLATPNTIKTFSRRFVIDCLTDACNSNLISEEGKNVYRTILWRLQPTKA